MLATLLPHEVQPTLSMAGDRLLLVICSFAKASVELPLRLRKGKIVRAVDPETDRALACERGVATLTLKPHDFALVELHGAEML